MKSIKTEIIINASKETVWNILTNYNNYPNWNPFIKSISGSTLVGQNISVNILNGEKIMNFKPVILTNNSQSEFRWKGKLFVNGLFDGEHYFKLEELRQDQVRLIHGENFSGLLSGLLLKIIEEDTIKGFKKMNNALKGKAEETA